MPVTREDDPPHYCSDASCHGAMARHPSANCCTRLQYVCSPRGLLQLAEALLALLVLVCVASSQAVLAGYSTLGPGLGYGSSELSGGYSGFEGAELQRVHDLDAAFTLLRAPALYGGVAFSLVAAVVTIGVMLAVARTEKRPDRSAFVRLLWVELFIDALGSAAFIAGVALYLYQVLEVNKSDTCKQREQLYISRGYTWMTCTLAGTDAAVAVFGLIAACCYLAGAVLCCIGLTKVRKCRQTPNGTHATADAASEDTTSGDQEIGDKDRKRNIPPRVWTTSNGHTVQNGCTGHETQNGHHRNEMQNGRYGNATQNGGAKPAQAPVQGQSSHAMQLRTEL
ncbi:MARVEL domain-containing protein 3-like [Petromyzon marinus]|uniref:MARVEL domain-containing protein 3-like n=1 Tax=Petromyzon marinus TaxID=7757 RepID=UPI003F71938E